MPNIAVFSRGYNVSARVATVPEPSTYALAVVGLVTGCLSVLRRKRRYVAFQRVIFSALMLMAATMDACSREASADPILFMKNFNTSTYKSQILRFDATTGTSLGNFLVDYDGAFIGGYTFGPDGNLYISDFNGLKINRYSGATGAFIDTFTTVTYSSPYQPLFGPDGNLYIGQATGRITKYDGATGQYLGVFVSPPNGAFDFGGMAFRGGNLYVSYIGSSGSLYRYDAATGGSGQQVYAGFFSNGPRVPVFDERGTIYVPDWQTNKIYKFDEATLALTGTITTASGISPLSLAFDQTGDLLVLSDNGSQSQVNRYDPTTGVLLGTLVAPGAGGLGRANNMAVVVPEPSTCVLTAAGLACFGWAALRQRNRRTTHR